MRDFLTCSVDEIGAEYFFAETLHEHDKDGMYAVKIDQWPYVSEQYGKQYDVFRGVANIVDMLSGASEFAILFGGEHIGFVFSPDSKAHEKGVQLYRSPHLCRKKLMPLCETEIFSLVLRLYDLRAGFSIPCYSDNMIFPINPANN